MNKSKESRRKEIIKIKAEINKYKTDIQIQETGSTKPVICSKKTTKTDEFMARIIEGRREE